MEVMLAPFAAAAIGVWAVRVLALWNPRVTAMRWVELSKITRAVGIIGLGMLLVARVADLRLPIEQCVVACVGSWLLLVGWRSAYRSWVAHQRRTGRSRGASSSSVPDAERSSWSSCSRSIPRPGCGSPA